MLDARLRQPIGAHSEIFLDGRNLTNQKTVDSYEVRGRRLIVGVRVEREDFSWW